MPDTKAQDSKYNKENIPTPKENPRVVSMSSVDTSNHKDEWLGNIVGQAILPAQLTRKNEGPMIDVLNELEKAKDTKFQHERLTIKLNDGTQLDTTEIKHKSDTDKKGYIIFFPGNDVNYTHLTNEVIDDTNNFNCVYFNYRGVGNSVGKACASQDLINDGIAQVERLLIDGVPPGLIYLYGYSLGGAVSTLVYEHFQKKGIYLGYCFNDRSFNNLETASPDSIAYITNIAQLSSVSNSIVNSILTAATKKGISQTNWGLNPAPAFANIPSNRKGGACVKWDHKKNIVGGDGIISDAAMMQDAQIKQYHYSRNFEAHIAPYDWLQDDKGKNPRENFYESCKQIRSDYLNAKEMAVALNKKFDDLSAILKDKQNALSISQQIQSINTFIKQLNEYEDIIQKNHFNDLVKQTNNLSKNLYNILSDIQFINKVSQTELSNEHFDELNDIVLLHEFLVKNLNTNPNFIELSSKLEQLLLDKCVPIMRTKLITLFGNDDKNMIDNFGINIFYILGLATDRMETEESYHETFLQLQKLSQQYAKRYTKYQERLIASIQYHLSNAEQKLNDIKQNAYSISPVEYQTALFEAKYYLDMAISIAKPLLSDETHHVNLITELSSCENLYTELKEQLKSRMQYEHIHMYPDSVTLESIEAIAKDKNKYDEVKAILDKLKNNIEDYTSATLNNNTDDILGKSKLIATRYFEINRALELNRKNKIESRLSENLRLKCLYYTWISQLDNILHILPVDISIYRLINHAKENIRLNATYNLNLNNRIELAKSLVDLHNEILSLLDKYPVNEKHDELVQLITTQRDDLIAQNDLPIAQTISSKQQNEMTKLHLSDRTLQKPQRSPRPEPDVELKQQKTF